MEQKIASNISNNISNNTRSKVNPMDKICAPARKFEYDSCMNVPELENIVRAWNSAHHNMPKQQIKLYGSNSGSGSGSGNKFDTAKYKLYLLAQCYEKIKDCDTQLCWTQHNKIVHNIDPKMRTVLSSQVWAPIGPYGYNNYTWLNTLDINRVLYQYELVFLHFKFLGALPNDFDNLPLLGIRNLNYKALLAKNKHQLGFIFNLDTSHETGSHWVAAYANLLKGQVYYYDSFAVRPTKEVTKLLNRICDFCKTELNIPDAEPEYNKIRHQFGESECGVFSIEFIHKLLQGISFEKYCKSKPSDAKINKLRTKFFRLKN
jgi:hypothetical protein